MYYGKLLRQMAESIKRLADLPQHVSGINERLDKYVKSIDAAKESEYEQQEIRQEWLNKVLTEHHEAERDKSANDNRNYRVQNSLRWATWLAFAAACMYAFIAFLQTRTMNFTYDEITKQTKAAQNAAYASCVNAQISQATLIQIQRSTNDSHSVAIATAKQTVAGIEAERAIVHVIPRFPYPEELVIKKLVIPYTVKNDGKSSGLNVDIKFRAILLKEGDTLRIDEKIAEGAQFPNIPSGVEVPDKPNDSRYRAEVYTIPVINSEGQTISSSSQEAQEFMNGGPVFVAVYGHENYSDFSGIHTMKFCNLIYAMIPGTTHQPTKSQITCAKYNHQEDHYTAMPKIDPYSAESFSRTQPITCVKPED